MASRPRGERRRGLVVETDRGWRVDDLHYGTTRDGCHPSCRRRTHRARRRQRRQHDDQPRGVFRGWLGAARLGEDLTRGAAGGSPLATARVTTHTPARSRPPALPAARSQGPPPRAPAPPTLDRHPPSHPRHKHHARVCFSKLRLMLFVPTDHHGQSGCLIVPTLAAPVSVCLRCTDRPPTRYARLRRLARSPLSRGCPLPARRRFPPVAGCGRSASCCESGTGNPLTQEGKHDDTTYSQHAR